MESVNRYVGVEERITSLLWNGMEWNERELRV